VRPSDARSDAAAATHAMPTVAEEKPTPAPASQLSPETDESSAAARFHIFIVDSGGTRRRTGFLSRISR
jgi:hypothetical protein